MGFNSAFKGLKNHRNVKTIKIPTVAPTCFGSLRNHHQGATSYLVKTTIMVLIVLVVNDVVNVMAAYQPVCKRAVQGRGRTLTTSLTTSTIEP